MSVSGWAAGKGRPPLFCNQLKYCIGNCSGTTEENQPQMDTDPDLTESGQI